MPSHSHNNPKTKYENLMLLYSYLSLLLYILYLPQINSGNKPGPSEDTLIKQFISIHKIEGRYWKYGREIVGQKTEKMQLFITHFMSSE